MKAIPETNVRALVKVHKNTIDSVVKKIHVKLRKRLKETADPQQRTYILELLSLKGKIVTAEVSELKSISGKFDDILELSDSEGDKIFKDGILSDLGYKKMRDVFFPKYFKQLGIKACVYCNSQLCIVVDNYKGGVVARLQLDHYMSKSHYPCLSIALSNLYPVCANCNNIKGVKEVMFTLYSDRAAVDKSPYNFEIVDKDIVVPEFLVNRNTEIIKIKFNEPEPDDESHHKLNDVFSIEGIYNTQLDIVEELILKRHIYDESYKETLVKDFPGIFGKDPKIIDRLIVGTYLEDNQIHLRPLSKFMQDIAKQVGLLVSS